MLTPVQEEVVIHLRPTLMLPLDDLLVRDAVVHLSACLTLQAGQVLAPPWRGQRQHPQATDAVREQHALSGRAH